MVYDIDDAESWLKEAELGYLTNGILSGIYYHVLEDKLVMLLLHN